MKEENKTYSNSSTLKIEDIKRAIVALRKNSKEPFITSLASRYGLTELFKKSTDARTFSLYGGIPCYTDKLLSEGIVRFYWSNGKIEDIKINNKPKFLTANLLSNNK